MPSLPRIRRTRPRSFAEAVVPRPEPRVAELSADRPDLDPPRPPIDPETVNDLRERFGWHPLDVEDVLSKRQRPKIDDYADDGYLFGVLHFPAYDKSDPAAERRRARLLPRPRLPRHDPECRAPPGHEAFQPAAGGRDLREQLFSKGSGRLLYEVLDDLFDYCFPILDKIAFKLDSIEDDIEERRSEEIVVDISKVKQEIISYRKIVKPQRPALRLLERHIERFLPEELELYFDDLVDASERIWDLLDNYKEVVEALAGHERVEIAHRQSDVLRILTVFSIIFLPLTLDREHLGDERPGLPAAATHRERHLVFWVIVAA